MSAQDRRFGTVVLTGATSGIGEVTARARTRRCDTLIVQGPEHPAAARATRVLHAAVADARSGSYLEEEDVVVPSAEVTDPGNRERLIALSWTRLSPFAPHFPAER